MHDNYVCRWKAEDKCPEKHAWAPLGRRTDIHPGRWKTNHYPGNTGSDRQGQGEDRQKQVRGFTFFSFNFFLPWWESAWISEGISLLLLKMKRWLVKTNKSVSLLLLEMIGKNKYGY